MKKPIVSIIIVHYKVKARLFDCLRSIEQSLPKVSYEIIVVDNDEEKWIEKELIQKFPYILYIKSPKNLGFGAGNNLGVASAKGNYLFFLNPDTIVLPNCIDVLVEYLSQHTNTAIAAPLLLDKDKQVYPLQGAKELTPLRGLVCLSFINTLFPTNPIAKTYFLLDWDKKHIQSVDVVPGTACMIRKDIFEKVGRFDERFFLYFEEHDLCNRVKKMGFDMVMIPEAKVIHFWGESTSNIKTEQIFAQSRFLYFSKHYGKVWAYGIELILSLRLYPFRRAYRGR